IRSNYASSNFDQRHLFHINYIYDIPLLHLWQRFASMISSDPDRENSAAVNPPPSAFATSSIAKLLLNGWQLSGITLFETGIPFTVVNNGSANGISVLDNAGVANGIGSGSYPDVIGDPRGGRPRLWEPGGQLQCRRRRRHGLPDCQFLSSSRGCAPSSNSSVCIEAGLLAPERKNAVVHIAPIFLSAIGNAARPATGYADIHAS